MANGVILNIEGLDSCTRTTREKIFESLQDSGLGRLNLHLDSAALCTATEANAADCLRLAEALILLSDRDCLRGVGESPELRLGLSCGNIQGQPWTGTVFRKAAKLSQSADPQQILVDDTVRIASRMPRFYFRTTAPARYEFRAQRLMKTKPAELFRNNLVNLYPDRDALRRDFTPARIMDLAEVGSTVLVAGRTLLAWSRLVAELRHAARARKLSFHFLISSEESCDIFEPHEQAEIKRVLKRSQQVFGGLARAGAESGPGPDPPFVARETGQAVVDGVTCARLCLPGAPDVEATMLFVILDVNAAPGDLKPSLVFACGENDDCPCVAHGLLSRTEHRFTQAHPLPVIEQPPVESNEGLPARNNRPAAYVHRLEHHFDAVKKLQLEPDRTDRLEVPPPLCVQFQVSGRCSTHCVMCDHHKAKEDGLSLDTWEQIFKGVAAASFAGAPEGRELRVESCIFSGGEPLTRRDLHKLLKSAKQHFRIGLLTNGTLESKTEEFREVVLDTIAETVDWVAISIDGRPDDDYRIRNPRLGEETRLDRLREFCRFFRETKKPEEFERFLSATVTLQAGNVGTDLRKLCDFIRGDLGIPQVNFKFATGARKALREPAPYLIDRNSIAEFERLLWHSGLADEPGNNLDYLRRCLAGRIFRPEDIRTGSPLYSYYDEHSLRCFIPFLFALIDLDGSVYPCCHLYRDNHGEDEVSQALRERHAVGKLVEVTGRGRERQETVLGTFAEIWNRQKYMTKRKELTIVDPKNDEFSPCGECTRYCQHNIGLNAFFKEYQTSGRIPETGEESNGPIWI